MGTHYRKDNIKKEFPKILRETFGIVSIACERAGVSRDAFYRWKKEDPIFAEECNEASERTGDFVENQLLKLIARGDTTATIFYCKTKLKARGYVERIEQTGVNGGAIVKELKLSQTDQQIIEDYKQKIKEEIHKC